jgi:hypothetical protein
MQTCERNRKSNNPGLFSSTFFLRPDRKDPMLTVTNHIARNLVYLLFLTELIFDTNYAGLHSLA